MPLSPKDVKEKPADPSFYFENDFCELADTFRAQFEEKISTAAEHNGGMTPLAYAFCQDAFQFLTAGSDHFFARDILEDFVSRLRDWAKGAVGASSVSTPQVRIYINGCWRHLLADGVSAPWHYMLSLTRGHAKGVGRIKILGVDRKKETNSQAVIAHTVSLPLRFNQLIVHNTKSPYSVEPKGNSMNPLDGTIFLDGYCW